MTYQERERETIRRLRQEVADRGDSPRLEWLAKTTGGELVQLDEIAELIYEVQS